MGMNGRLWLSEKNDSNNQIIQTFEFKRLEDCENGLKNVCISITRKQTFEEAQTRAS